MRVSAMFPSKYLKASDIPDGREAHVKVDVVHLELMEQTGEEKPVCYFLDREKCLVLNQTNAKTIGDAFGDDTEEWHGKSVVLFSTTTNFGGRMVPCIRVRVPRQAPAEQPAPVATTDDMAAANHSLMTEGDANQTDDIPF